MKTSLSTEFLRGCAEVLDRVTPAAAPRAGSSPREPIHTVYGGAHLFSAKLPEKLGQLAIRSLEDYAPDAAAFAEALGQNRAEWPAEEVYGRLRNKLRREPVEDYRIDFEDGYGHRPDAEEDGHAASAAAAVAEAQRAGALPPFVGIRIKPLTAVLRTRSLRTLDVFHTALAEAAGGEIPAEWVVTLPKVRHVEEVAVLADALGELERRLGLSSCELKLELMVETPRALVATDGTPALGPLVRASGGRCVAAHFGTYDYTAENDIVATHQTLTHPICDFAKFMMKASLAGTGIRLSDGATTTLPVAPHRRSDEPLTASQREENRRTIHRAWRLHFENVGHGLGSGFYQGWDLHPAQLAARYAAVYGFFLTGAADAGDRLRRFVQRAAQATLTGDRFDDAATGQGLLNFFLRATSCGAMSPEEAAKATGLDLSDLESRSFERIVTARQGRP